MIITVYVSVPNSSYTDVFPPFGLVGRQLFKIQFLISCLVERTKLRLVRPSKSLIGELKCLEQGFNKKVCLFVRWRCVCVCVRWHACLSVAHVLAHFLLFDDRNGHVCFAYPGFPDSSATVEWLRQSKERDEQRERKAGGGISQLNISGTFPSLSPLSVYIKLV